LGPPFIVGLDLRPIGTRAAGIILIDVVVPGTMRDAVVERNYVHDNSRYRPGEGIPSASGNGILLGGGKKKGTAILRDCGPAFGRATLPWRPPQADLRAR